MGRLLSILVLATAAHAQGKPLPLRKSVILPSGGSYYVEGRQEIRWGQELSVQKETVIKGRGAGATLVVHGALQVRGVSDKKVRFENLIIEVAEKCERVHLDMVVMIGCAIRTPKDKACLARVHIENAEVETTPIDLRLTKGEVTILGSKISSAILLTGVKEEEDQKKPPPTRVLINGCNVNRDLVVHQFKHTVIRAVGIYGTQCKFTDCYELTFDGNEVKGPGVIIEQSKPGRLKKTKISKCDFHGSVLHLNAPRDGKKKDKVPVDKCWFNGRTKVKEIIGRDIRDGSVNEQSGAYVVMRKVNKRPLGLGGLTLPAGSR
ncbi:MAG: hypothetical protein ACYTHK_10245 [Planctomycetota bacterium]